MKIYFDGGSFTNGEHLYRKLGVDDWKEKRWSKLLANKLDAEEYNFSCGGGSNQRILRNITTKHNISDYDFAVIIMTTVQRTEIFHKGKFRNILPTKKFKDPEVAKFWNFYYKNIYDKEYGRVYEEVIQKSIKAICATNNVPLLLMSDRYYWSNNSSSPPSNTKLSFDMLIPYGKYESVSPTDKHPNLEAQPKIADDIYNFINKYKRFY